MARMCLTRLPPEVASLCCPLSILGSGVQRRGL